MEWNESKPLWPLVGALEHQTLKAWRTQQFPSRDLEDAYANECKWVESKITRGPGASTVVTISVCGRQGWKSGVQVFWLQMVEKGAWKVTADTLNL